LPCARIDRVSLFLFVGIRECLERELVNIRIKVLQKGVRGFSIEHWELRNWSRVRHCLSPVGYAVRPSQGRLSCGGVCPELL
jgi:hypothetical protein